MQGETVGAGCFHQGMETLTPPPATAHRERPLERVEAEIVELSSQLTAATARLTALIGEFDAAEGWRDWGMRSTAHWLSWQCGIGRRAGREQVRVARALRALPLVAAAFIAGRLSYSKVRAITRLATPETEAELVEIAEHATAAQLEQLLAAKRRAGRADDVRDRRKSEYLNLRVDEDGSLVGSFRISPERGAVLTHALDIGSGRVGACSSEGTEAEGTEAKPADPKVPRRSRIDALVGMAEKFLEGCSAEHPHADETAGVYELVIHTTRESLRRPDDAPDDGPATELRAHGGATVRLHPATARRLTCDCPASEMIDGVDGSAVHVGRRTRRIRGRLRRAVHARDRGLCRAPGCTEPATQIHHIRHWAHGGPTCLRNLVSLCDQHHWLVHEGGWTIAGGRPGEWVLTSPDGLRVGPRPTMPATVPPLPHDPAIAADAVTGHWAGERLDADPVLRRLMATAADAQGGSAEPLPAEPSTPPAASTPSTQFQFTREQIDQWAANVERMQREASLADAFFVDD